MLEILVNRAFTVSGQPYPSLDLELLRDVTQPGLSPKSGSSRRAWPKNTVTGTYARVWMGAVIVARVVRGTYMWYALA